jgi:hypothetical protein
MDKHRLGLPAWLEECLAVRFGIVHLVSDHVHSSRSDL